VQISNPNYIDSEIFSPLSHEPMNKVNNSNYNTSTQEITRIKP